MKLNKGLSATGLTANSKRKKHTGGFCGALRGTYHRLAVIGLLHELGSDTECNDFLDKFRDSLSMRKWSPTTRVRTST